MKEVGGEHRAHPSVERLLEDLVDEGVMFKLGGVKFNDGLDDGDDSIDQAQIAPMSQFVSVNSFIADWLYNGYSRLGGDGAELQLDALHIAAQDMTAHSIPGNPNRYVVLVTDAPYHYLNDGTGTNTTMTKALATSELTNCGSRAYISLWEGLMQLQEFYVGLTVNSGEFDPVDYGTTDLAEIYPFDRLRARIMADWPSD